VTGGLAWLREITATLIAAVVVIVTMILLWMTFNQTAAPDFQQKKDVMLYGLTILGTVIGYYFGRVPAERRAETAEQRAGEAQSTASEATVASTQAQQQARQAARAKDEATKKLAEAKTGIERAKAALAPTAEARRKTLGAGGAPSEAATDADRTAAAYMELEVLSRQL
jgi:hypothetical protein